MGAASVAVAAAPVGDAARVGWIDGVRAVGAALVVLNHVSVPLLWSYHGTLSAAFTAGVVAHALSASAVHLFFLVAGQLAFSRPVSDEALALRRRIGRLLVPWAAYTALYALGYAWLDGAALASPWAYLATPAAFHLWFFAPMALVGALGVLLRPGSPSRTGVLLCGALLLLNGHAFRPFGGGGAIDEGLAMVPNLDQVGVLLSWFLLAVLGHHLGALRSTLTLTLSAVLLFALSTVAIALATFSATSATQQVELRYLDDLGLPCLFQAVGAYLALRGAYAWVARIPGAARVLSALATRSLGVYGLHVAVLELLRRRLGLDGWLFLEPWSALVATSVFVLVLSWGAARSLAFIDRRGVVV